MMWQTARRSDEVLYMNSNYKLIKIRDHAEMMIPAAEWFNQKWGVPVDAYIESMQECIADKTGRVQWYVILDGDKIVCGMGVIENDFHNRKDLAPNICAVFTEEDYRGQGLAKYLMDYISAELSAFGCDTLYLLTSHTDFYEKCGFYYFCDAVEDCGDTARIYRRVSHCGESMIALKSFLDNEGRLTSMPAKRKMKLHILVYLSEKIVYGRVYNEREINALLDEWHTYGDPVTLRRELVDHKILVRDPYGKEYKRCEFLPTIEQLVGFYE